MIAPLFASLPSTVKFCCVLHTAPMTLVPIPDWKTAACVHGTRDPEEICICDKGWTTALNQNFLKDPMIYCNSSSYRSTPPKYVFSNFFIGFLICLAIVWVLLIALVIRKYFFKSSAAVRVGSLSEEQQVYIRRLKDFISVPHVSTDPCEVNEESKKFF